MMDLKAILIPPSIAMLLYFGAMYLLVPVYRQRERYAQYLPMAFVPSDQPGMVSRTRRRVQDALSDFATYRVFVRRPSGASEDFNLGDEELDEVTSDHLSTGLRGGRRDGQ